MWQSGSRGDGERATCSKREVMKGGTMRHGRRLLEGGHIQSCAATWHPEI